LKIKFKYVKILTTSKDDEFNKEERNKIEDKDKNKDNKFDKKECKATIVFQRIIENRNLDRKAKKVIATIVRIRLD